MDLVLAMFVHRGTPSVTRESASAQQTFSTRMEFAVSFTLRVGFVNSNKTQPCGQVEKLWTLYIAVSKIPTGQPCSAGEVCQDPHGICAGTCQCHRNYYQAENNTCGEIYTDRNRLFTVCVP